MKSKTFFQWRSMKDCEKPIETLWLRQGVPGSVRQQDVAARVFRHSPQGDWVSGMAASCPIAPLQAPPQGVHWFSLIQEFRKQMKARERRCS